MSKSGTVDEVVSKSRADGDIRQERLFSSRLRRNQKQHNNGRFAQALAIPKMKKEIRIGDKSPYDAFCSRCCTKFSNKSNLRRHLKGRRSPCKLGEQSGRIWIEDEQTGNTRLLRPEERAQWTRRRKRENYIR